MSAGSGAMRLSSRSPIFTAFTNCGSWKATPDLTETAATGSGATSMALAQVAVRQLRQPASPKSAGKLDARLPQLITLLGGDVPRQL